jgi:hypothetical protein
MSYLKQFLGATIILGVCLVIGTMIVPVSTGVWYNQCGERWMEQERLDKVITHLIQLRQRCPDSELRGVLSYTIARYNRIGGFDVMVIPCWTLKADTRCAGMNHPFCPGITIDPEMLMGWSVQEAATILVHEALHDYFPYAGHTHIDPIMKKMERLH